MTGSLQGLKVLDFSTLLPGPYASMLLADMGAEVLKVESPRLDMVHTLTPNVVNNGQKTSYANLTLNRNKKSILLDLKRQECIEVIKRLVLDYDIIIEQFRPGVMAKLGLDFATLSAINPKLIYCSITGYGQTGPMKDKAGHDINYLALSGIASYSGKTATGPVLAGTQIADIAGGSHHAVMSILAAVFSRHNTEKGQWLDVSMTDAAFSLNALFGPGSLVTEHPPQLSGTLLNGGSFYDYYQTQDGRYLSVGGLEPKFAKLFFALLGQPQWFTLSMTPDTQIQEQLKQKMVELIASKTLAQWQVIFDNSDVCVEPVLTVNEAADSALMKQRNMIVDVPLGDQFVRQIAPVVKFSQQKSIFTIASVSGQHTKEVLNALGYSQSSIDNIMKQT
jgi:crotonobetainyl-CoA:carnitine CoA-transferase CaiB-like acyl-CoA transferase